MSDPLRLDAVAQLQLLETRRLGAVELLELSVARGRALADTVNAVAAADLAPARAAARHIDERRAAIQRVGGDPADELGLLGGLPMSVMDAIDVDGLPASCGAARLASRECADADVVGRVRAAGAVVWGKTNTSADPDDWRTDNRLYGRTANPWDGARTPGGACGGAAAAVAAGVTALEIGAEAGGALRLAAGLCGVFAHRPTRGLVSQRGHARPGPGTLAEPDLVVLGPLARSARDLRLLLSVLAPAAIPSRTLPAVLPGLRVGLWLEAEGFTLEAPVRAAVEAWALALAAQGATVEQIPPPAPPGRLLRAFDTLDGAERARAMSSSAYGRRRALRPVARMLAAAGAAPGSWAARTLAVSASHRDWMRADEVRARLAARMSALFARWDVVVAPAAPVVAPLYDARVAAAGLARWSLLASTLGLPATCIPAGFAAGLPVGVQIIGPVGGDSRTLAVAEACEVEIGGFVPAPLKL